MPASSIFLDRTADWIFQASWQAAVLVGLILVIQALFRRQLSARWRSGLWLLVVVRLLLPVVPASSASLFNLPLLFENYFSSGFSDSPASAPVVPQPDVESLGRRAEAFDLPRGAASTSADFSLKRTPAVLESRSPWPWKPIAIFLWLSGACFCLLRLMIAWLRLARQIAVLPEVTDPAVFGIWRSCKAELGVRRAVGLVLAREGTGPAVTGILRPRLLIPRSVLAAFSPEELRMLFFHELTHLRRSDVALHWLMGALRAVHWFNPVIWWAFHRAEMDRELACDEAVLMRLTPPHRFQYGHLVLKLVQSIAVLRPLPGAVGTLHHPSSMKRRITMIAGFRTPSRWASLLAVAFVMVLGLTALTDGTRGANVPSTAFSEGPATASKTSVAKQCEKPDKECLMMMGLVEDFFMHNFRDVTARKSLGWGKVEKHADGSRSIRYKYQARIWDKKTIIDNQIFTFDKDDKFVDVEHVKGFPKKKTPKSANLGTKEGMKKLVEDFFKNNFRDVTARKTLEWGEVEEHADGSRSLRYKYKASIWDKENLIMNQVFTFDKEGNFVKYKNVAGFPKKIEPKADD